MTKYFFLILLFCVSYTAQGQIVKGNVKNAEGKIMSFASVYVKETTFGVATDLKGDYFIQLKTGEHILVYSYLGFTTQEQIVQLKKDQIYTLNIVLEEDLNEIGEIEIFANAQELTDQIMNNVRSNRSKYQTAIKSYSCNTYLKTALDKHLARPSKKDTIKSKKDTLQITAENLSGYFKKERVNLIESYEQLYYKSPREYKTHVYAHHDYSESARPQGVVVTIGGNYGPSTPAPTQYVKTNPYIIYTGVQDAPLNFYNNYIDFKAVCTKPLLSPLAFNSGWNYKFRLKGSFIEDGQKIYNIEVTPRFPADALFYGHIFIEDSTWALRSVDLNINRKVMHYCNDFNIIQNYKLQDENCYLPVRRTILYTIKEGKYDILGSSTIIHDNYKVNEPIESNFGKNEVQSYEEDAFDKSRKYWDDIRPITLKTPELKFIHKTDSLEQYFNSTEYKDKQDSTYNDLNIWSYLLTGIRHKGEDPGYKFTIYPLVQQLIPFGVGGYRHRLGGTYNYEFNNHDQIMFEGEANYGFLNEDLKGKIGLGWTYLPTRFVTTFIRVSDDYELINNYESIEAIFSRSNYVRAQSVSVSQKMEIINGLFGELSFTYSNKHPINNLQLAEWSKALFGELNTPQDFDAYLKSEIQLDLLYRYRQKYMYRRGKKILLGSTYPDLTFKYRKGIPNLFNSEVDFDYLELGATHDLDIARYGNLRWEFQAGSFVNKKDLRLLEHRFFRGSDYFLFSNPLNSFQLLGPTLNTRNEYLRMQFIHHFEGTILNKVPLINLLKLQLAAGAGTLVINDIDFRHFEMFAGLEKIFRIRKQLFKITAYAVTADNTLSNPDIRFKIGFGFYDGFSKKWNY